MQTLFSPKLVYKAGFGKKQNFIKTSFRLANKPQTASATLVMSGLTTVCDFAFFSSR